MRNAVTILLLVTYALTLVVGRCQTVWHVPGSDAVLAHGQDHTHDNVIFQPFADGEHHHDEPTPDHSHVLTSDAERNAPRADMTGPIVAAPAQYAQLSNLLAVLADQDSCRTHRLINDEIPPPPEPMAGRTVNLLF